MQNNIKTAVEEVVSCAGSLDDMCYSLQERFGIDSGDGAAYCLNEHEQAWRNYSPQRQRTLLAQWLRFELGE